MKRLIGVCAIIAIFMLCGAAMADEVVKKSIIDSFIEDRIVKTGIAYDIFDRETKTALGMILVEDFYFKNLDLDFFIDGDKSVGVGLDYMFRKGNDVQPYIGMGGWLDRIEKIDTVDEWGEYFVTLNAGVRFKF